MRLKLLAKNIKKVDFSEVESVEDSEKLESMCEPDEESGCNRKKYPIFIFPKDMSYYKYELQTYFATKVDFKEATTIYAVESGRNLKF